MSGAQALAIARNIAAERGYLISEQQDRKRDGRTAPAYVLYRKATPRNVRVAKRASPRAVLDLVQTITGK
jgi:hypothetical protein